MDRDPYDRDARGGEPFDRYPPARSAVHGGGHVYRKREPDDDESSRRWRVQRRRRKPMPLWQELPLLLMVAFCLAVLIRTFLLQAFYIPSGSMEGTLLVGDRVLVNKIVYDVRDPERGEIVVFRGTDDWAPENPVDTDVGFFAKLGRTIGDLVGISQPGEKDFIKRVIGLPGDVIACCDVNGNVTVNGYSLDERPYLPDDHNSPRDRAPTPRECGSRIFGPVTVAPGQIFVMGDHRLVSQDSRCQGQVPIDNVIGRAFVVVWPSQRWEGLSVPATFGQVPRPFAAGTSPLVDHVDAPVRDGRRTPGGLLGTAAIFASWAVPARSRHSAWPRQRRLPS
jgi:signal peptidase I